MVTQGAEVVSVGEGDVLIADARWNDNIHRYQLYTSLMIGGHRVLCPPSGTAHPITGGELPDGSYLRRLPGETSVRTHDQEDTWEVRRDSAAHDPVAARIIWVYVDTLFRQQIDRSAVRDELGDGVVDDIDLQGTTTEDWLPRAYAWGLSQGWCLALVDMLSMNPDDYPSLAHLEAAGERPYVQLILPSRVWAIELDRFGRVSMAIIHEKEGVWKLWEENCCVVLDSDGKKIGPPKIHAFGRPPFEIFRATDPDPDDATAPLGESAMGTTSLIDLQILQAMSLGDDVQRKTSFPFYHVQRDPEEDGTGATIMMGPDLVYRCDAKGDWKAPPAELGQSQRDYITMLEALAYKMGGVHRRSQDSVEAHSGLALDYESSPMYATVQRWARRLAAWEIRIWRLMAGVMGRNPDLCAVVYPDDFTSRPAEQDIGQAKSIWDSYGGRASAPPWVQLGGDLLIHRALERLVGHTPAAREVFPKAISGKDYLPDQTAAKVDISAEIEELKAKLSVIEQLVKAKAPNELVRTLMVEIAELLGAATPEVLAAIGEAEFRWYTEVQAELSAGQTVEEIESNASPGDGES